MDDKIKTLRKVEQASADLDPIQADLLATVLHIASEVRAGRIIGLFGVIVAIDDDEDDEGKVVRLEEGYTLSESESVLALEAVARDLRESWEAERFSDD